MGPNSFWSHIWILFHLNNFCYILHHGLTVQFIIPPVGNVSSVEYIETIYEIRLRFDQRFVCKTVASDMKWNKSCFDTTLKRIWSLSLKHCFYDFKASKFSYIQTAYKYGQYFFKNHPLMINPYYKRAPIFKIRT